MTDTNDGISDVDAVRETTSDHESEDMERYQVYQKHVSSPA